MRIPQVLLVFILCLPGICLGQAPLEDGIIFWASFDYSLDADLAAGGARPQAGARVRIVPDGKFGAAASLPHRSWVRYLADKGNLDPRKGTVTFWIKPGWEDGSQSRPIFNFRCDGGDYVNLNIIPGGRLGIAMRGGEKNWVWKRVDEDVTGWKPGLWHHVAAAWGGGKLRFFLDGREIEEKVDDAKPVLGTAEAFWLTGSDYVLDDLRIFNRMLTPEEVKMEFEAKLSPRPFVSLARLKPAASRQRLGKVGLGCRLRTDGMKMPLILKGEAHADGIGMTSPASVEFEVDPRYARLVGVIGVDDLAGEETSVVFRILADGKEVFKSARLGRASAPQAIDVSLSGAKRLALETEGGSGRTGFADWAGVMLLAPGTRPVPSAARKLRPDEFEMYRKRRDAYRFTFTPPAGAKGYALARANYLDEIDPAKAPEDLGRDVSLSTFAAPGEYEPVCFVIYAFDDIKALKVGATDLKCGPHTIPAAALDIRAVMRCLYRNLYTLPPEKSTVVSRFLVHRPSIDVQAGTFQQIHVTIHVPEAAKPGIYKGALKLSSEGRRPSEIPLSLEVLPFKLKPLERKRYGMYYRLASNLDAPEKLALELKDLREHGASTLYPGIGITYEKVEDKVRPNYDLVRNGLAAMKKFGFSGEVPIGTGFNHLARLLGHSDVGHGEGGESLDGDEEFMKAAKEALEGLLEVQKEFPEFEILVTHMDEVLGRGRLPLYIRLTRAARQVPDFRVYITMHNKPAEVVEELTREIDPYVDVRCYNGHCMDEWLQAGHTFDELAEQLRKTGDEAWIYYNIRGSFFLAQWMRIVNGLYMWLGPFKVHCPWMYHSYQGDPFDDTDGPRLRGHDFAYAVPDPADGKTPVPTRHWEAYREGVDDMRYIAMLEDLIAGRNDKPAQDARKWLDSIRAGIPWGDVAAIEEESPVLIAVTRKFSGDDLQKMRYTTARHIIKVLGD